MGETAFPEVLHWFEQIHKRLQGIEEAFDRANDLKQQEIDLLRNRNSMLEKSLEAQIAMGAHQIDHDADVLDIMSGYKAKDTEEATEEIPEKEAVTVDFDKENLFTKALAIKCPQCEAEPGASCSQQGKFGRQYLPAPHVRRIEEAQKDGARNDQVQ